MEHTISFKTNFGWINAKELDDYVISVSFGKLNINNPSKNLNKLKKNIQNYFLGQELVWKFKLGIVGSPLQIKASLMMGRESSFRRCESAARQLLVFDRIIDPSETIKQIDAVSKETVEKIAKQIVAGPMTISSIGPIKKLETLYKIQSRLN